VLFSRLHPGSKRSSSLFPHLPITTHTNQKKNIVHVAFSLTPPAPIEFERQVSHYSRSTTGRFSVERMLAGWGGCRKVAVWSSDPCLRLVRRSRMLDGPTFAPHLSPTSQRRRPGASTNQTPVVHHFCNTLTHHSSQSPHSSSFWIGITRKALITISMHSLSTPRA
jgi:hypothetical protein